MAKKTVSTSDPPMTKTGFIRSLAPDVAPDEVVAQAKERGIELTKKLVYTTQSAMRGQAKAANRRAGKVSKSKPKSKVKRQGSETSERRSPTSAALDRAAASATAPAITRSRNKSRSKLLSGFSVPADGAERRMRALIVELGTARAEHVYRTVKGELAAMVGNA